MEKIEFTPFDTTHLLKWKLEEFLSKADVVKFKKPIAFTFDKQKYECVGITKTFSTTPIQKNGVNYHPPMYVCQLRYNVGGGIYNIVKGVNILIRSQLLKLIKAINNN